MIRLGLGLDTKRDPMGYTIGYNVGIVIVSLIETD